MPPHGYTYTITDLKPLSCTGKQPIGSIANPHANIHSLTYPNSDLNTSKRNTYRRSGCQFNQSGLNLGSHGIDCSPQEQPCTSIRCKSKVPWTGGLSGSSICTTNIIVKCEVKSGAISENDGSTTFTLGNINHTELVYLASDNHDPDGDSDGTRITDLNLYQYHKWCVA